MLRSPDLANWTYLHPFVEDDLFTLVGDDGACPYFWPIGDRHILLFYSHMSGGQYLLGDYDKERDKFVVTAHDKCNFGALWSLWRTRTFGNPGWQWQYHRYFQHEPRQTDRELEPDHGPCPAK